MAMWRCPHCGTPQAETARCWVCRRSSTACGSCRHFRRSVAAQLGYCGLDRQRLALRGDEIRSCWDAPLAAFDPDDGGPGLVATGPLGATDDRTAVRRLEFVPVDAGDAGRSGRRVSAPGPPEGAPQPPPSPGAASLEARWSLWGDVEG